MTNIAATAVSFLVLSAVTGAQISNHSVQMAAVQRPKVVVAAAKSGAQPVIQPVVAVPVTPPTPLVVTVQAGDSLSSIASANGTSYSRLFNANTDIADPNVITPGEQIRIPAVDEQLSDRAVPQAVVATVTTASYSTTKAAATTTSYPAVTDNDAKAFIYSHESGNNPNATNPTGCYGLGQDCNGRLRALCGADYACQDAFFTNYAMSRYGSWSNAEAFWLRNNYW